MPYRRKRSKCESYKEERMITGPNGNARKMTAGQMRNSRRKSDMDGSNSDDMKESRVKTSLTRADFLKMEKIGEFEVEKILMKCVYKGRIYYKLRWKYYSPDFDYWEPKSECNCDELIADFEENKTAADVLTDYRQFEKEQTYIPFDGVDPLEYNYILENEYGVGSTCNGFAYHKTVDGVENLIIPSGAVMVTRAWRGSSGKRIKGGHWAVEFNPGLIEAIYDDYTKYDRVIFPISFVPCDPRLNDIRLKKDNKKRQTAILFEKARFHTTWGAEHSIHSALLVHNRSDNKVYYHDDLNRVICGPTAHRNKLKYRRLANDYLFQRLRNCLPIKPLQKKKGSKKKESQFVSQPAQCYTMCKNGCALLPLRIIQSILKDGSHITKWTDQQESKDFCFTVKDCVELGHSDGSIVYPELDNEENKEAKVITFRDKYLKYVKRSYKDSKSVNIGLRIILKWMKDSSLMKYASKVSYLYRERTSSPKEYISYKEFKKLIVSVAEHHKVDPDHIFDNLNVD